MKREEKSRLLKAICKIVILSALAAVIMLFEIPLFFAPSFYKLDLSDLVALIGGFAMGPGAGALIQLLKNLLNILLDGGRGHVSVIRDLLEEKGIDIPVFGMVKDEYHKTRALVGEGDEISIAREQAVFQFIYKIQEEVHRFTIKAMSSAKSKSLTHSTLEKINGIGQGKAKSLLSHFGTIKAIKAASVEEIAAAKGISQKNAEDIYNYYHPEDK